ncbi:putative quinol monooxygenase [Caballeronia humi]|uniref:Antibiotic biosynthesis monooxygenase n=1 Tax=Caballeronia humi TaxID=326474 RepID=A0A158I035_9BURK|nr:antibiotic biosynthesis monooxygenase [Caballeronia humi]SAL49501.1 Antibiotic biosynthesis monooxygenase [Caballeronia humi]
MKENTSFIVHLQGKPEHREELESKLIAIIERMAEEPDFVNAYVNRSKDEPETLVIYETWACSAEYFRAHHLGLPYRQDYEAALPRLLSRERTIEFLQPMRDLVRQ